MWGEFKKIWHITFCFIDVWTGVLFPDSTDTEYFARPMGHLIDSIYGNQKSTTLLPGNIVASAPTQPLSMNLLDSLTVHAKMRCVSFSKQIHRHCN